MGILPSNGVTIRFAEGGFIIEWMEPKEPSGFVEHEHDPIWRHRAQMRSAVRVRLDETLNFAGEVLSRLKAAGVESGEDLDA